MTTDNVTPPSQTQTAPEASPQPTEVKTSPADAAVPTEKKAEPAKKEADQLLFEGDKVEDKPGDEKKEGEEKPKDDSEVAVVKIEDLVLPEDIQISEDMKAPLTEFITANKLTKEQAQGVTDLGVKMQQQQLENWAKTKTEWRKEVETDPEIGGTKLEGVKKEANRVIRQFAGTTENLQELQQDLILLGLGNKRSFVRFLNNVAKATGSDQTVSDSASGGAPEQKDMAKTLWPNMK